MEKKKSLIRTRFAPSPTGELHIGGARTTLFNYLLAREKEGRFILRIEDTDIKRNREEFINNQYEDLCWLGLKPDESIFQVGEYGPYKQTERLDIYQKYVKKLIQAKNCYYCFCSSEELELEKEEYIKKNQRGNYQYSRKCLNLTEQQIKSFLQNQKNYLIRFQVDHKKSYEFQDLVRGKVIFQGHDIEDFVICRSNGIPLLNFAVTIDDHLMKISHVLRGEEHLSNTGKQLVLYEALGWNPPLFGHISLILNKEKKKLSKRDQETSQFQLINQLREKGYLPQAIVNYLLFLGWHPGNGITQEIFSLKEAIKVFKLTGLHAKGAVYDLEKLNWYNNYYIQQLTEKELGEHSWQFLGKEYNLEKEKKDWVKQISLLFRPQLNYFHELINLTWYFFQELSPIKLDLSPESEKELLEVEKSLAKLEKWSEENIRQTLFNKKKIFPSMRLKLTSKKKGPELPKIIYLLGKDLVIKRLKSY